VTAELDKFHDPESTGSVKQRSPKNNMMVKTETPEAMQREP
jgi:hypothetical protein